MLQSQYCSLSESSDTHSTGKFIWHGHQC